MFIKGPFVRGRLLLVFGIGYTAEKVTVGVDSVHVSASNTLAWREALLHIADDDEVRHRLGANIPRPLGYDDASREAPSVFVTWKEPAHA